MKYCLFTYQPLKSDEALYSLTGLKQLSPKLTELRIFPYSSEQLRKESQRLAGKISIQGVQPKLSVQLSIKAEVFKVVERSGAYIVKPQASNFPNLPENEDLTMHLAKVAKIAVPWHGLIKCDDDSLAYVIRRFDRKGHYKVPQEDFAQLLGAVRTTKYEATMEQVAGVIDEFCTFRTLEWLKLFRRIVFSFLVGNEDMHLKNFSLLTDEKGRKCLTPAYDFLNSTIAMPGAEEELALSLREKKRGFKRQDFVWYAETSLFLHPKKSEKIIDELLAQVPLWKKIIKVSFLTGDMKKAYQSVLQERVRRLAT